MALQALLLSRDPEVHRTIRRVLDAANIDLDLSNNADQARHILLRRKYDALLVDCDDMPNGPLVLRELRQGKSNKSCIAFALVNGKTTIQQAFEMGANFVLDKPISLERATRSVRAAQGLIMRERRRYHRHLIKATGAILVDQGAELPLNITNISQGGISIECSRKLDEGGAARVRLQLPGNKRHWTSRVKLSGQLRKAELVSGFRCYRLTQRKIWMPGWKNAHCHWAAARCSSTLRSSG